MLEQEIHRINGKLKLVGISQRAHARSRNQCTILHICSVIKAVRHRNVMLNWWNWFSMHPCHGCKCTANDTFNKSNRNELTTNLGWLYCTPFHGASRTISKSPDRILLSQVFFSVPNVMFVVGAFLHKILIIYWVSFWCVYSHELMVTNGK